MSLCKTCTFISYIERLKLVVYNEVEYIQICRRICNDTMCRIPLGFFSGKPASPTVTLGSPRVETPQGLPHSVQLGLLQSLRGASPNITQNLTSALRQELLAQHQNSRSPTSSPTVSSPSVHKVTEKVTFVTTAASTVSSSPSAQLVTRLVQQVSGNQMVNVGNLLTQRVQGPRGNVPTTLKIQGMHQKFLYKCGALCCVFFLK